MDQKDFIAEYCNIVDQCHGQRPDKLWFATWMSSKSPYFDFPKRFELFWKTKKLDSSLKFEQIFFSYLKLAPTLLGIAAKSFYVKRVFRKELKALSQDVSYTLLRTFYYSPQSRIVDPFWGELLSENSAAKENFLTIYDPMFPIKLCREAYDPQKNNFPYHAFLPIGALVKNYFAMALELLKNPRFRGDFQVKGKNLSDLVNSSYKQELVSPATLVSLAYYESFFTIFHSFQIKKALLPFESNPWEKMFHLAKRNSKKNFLTVSFQHSTVQQGATSYFLSAYENKNHFVPDRILTTGKYPKELLSSYPHYHNLPLEEGCALRYRYLEKYTQLKNLNFSSIKALVILDGTEDAGELVDVIKQFIKNCSPEKNQIELLMREHPNMPILSRNEAHSETTWSITKESLETNLQWANVIIYSGSTVALEALKVGIPVINFQNGLFNYDPLFDLHKFKWNIKNHLDLFGALKTLQTLSSNEITEQAESAKKFIDNYFSPCTHENIEKFLS